MRKKIIELYEQGLFIRDIANKLDIKCSYVYNILNRHMKESKTTKASE